MTPNQIAAALASVTEAKLNGVFDPEAMPEAGIYPEIWDPVGWHIRCRNSIASPRSG
ncbi:DUF1877 family protein [Leptothrix ochracea]|uniref:DUF1877 family protein n=1 Tax=Leptothrix ochracea TaxID=735331 RepID=UPI0034E2D398